MNRFPKFRQKMVGTDPGTEKTSSEEQVNHQNRQQADDQVDVKNAAGQHHLE